MSSGALEAVGYVGDLEGVEKYLFSGVGGAAQDDWRWEEEEDANVSAGGQSQGNGIQDCVVGVSPTGDVMVICRQEKAVILSGQWDSDKNRNKYSKAFEGNLSQEGETITCAMCIPLVSSKKSSPGAPDWTCVVLGFSDGYVRMYTENGSLLLSQMFHDEGVQSFKCQSYKGATSQNEHDRLEEVLILYKSVLVTVEGFGLFQTLRGCRSRIAKVQANAAETMVEPPPLSYKKWQYDSEGVKDCVCVGVKTPPMFDHLLTASIIGGVHARPSKVPYTTTVFTAVGATPYVSYHYAQEGQAPLMIGQLAYTVANKLTNSLMNAASGWLGFGGGAAKAVGGPPSKPEKPKIEPATPMAGRFGLPDRQRRGKSISTSPCHKLSAVTDSLGRVVLLDNERGIAVRMWKGYRDAQCAWIAVNDDMNARTRVSGRTALFLVIYAPRKGQIEVFSMQQGPKVATFPVTKSGRLIDLPFGMMGLNNAPMKGYVQQQTIPCLLLDPSGELLQLQIPFHLALCDNSNTKLKDMHLLKTLQRMLRDGQENLAEINKIMHDIQNQAMINQAFKILASYCKSKQTMSDVIEGYLHQFCDRELRDLTIPFKIQSLLQLYTFLVSSIEAPPEYEEEACGSDNTALLCLHATEKEIRLVKDIANKELLNKARPQKGVSFLDESKVINVNEFISIFNIEYDPLKIKASVSSEESRLSLNGKSDNLPKLDVLIFCGCFNNTADLSRWKNLVKSCDLDPLELMLRSLNFWCHSALQSSSYLKMMKKLYQIVRAICELEGASSTLNEGSTWWETIRKNIAGSSNLFYIYSFTMVCRAVTIDLNEEVELTEQQVKKKNQLADSNNPACPEKSEPGMPEPSSSSSPMDVDKEQNDDEDWETVSLDLIRWNILLKQIEDLSLLSTILNQSPPLSQPKLSKLCVPTADLSVSTLLEKGPGGIAELVGRWLTSIGIDPMLIIDNKDSSLMKEVSVAPEYTEKEFKQKVKGNPELVQDTKMETNEETELENATTLGSEVNYIKELLRCLKENFHVSLNSSIILCNYCWEYCLQWNQSVESTEYLSAAVSCASAVPSTFIKQGLMSLMWSTFISKQLSHIIGKGKLKKEKLLEKLSTFNSPQKKADFLSCCVKFLDDFMEVNVLCQGSSLPKGNSRRQRNHWTGESSAPSLADMCLVQPMANYEMILLHYQLSLAALFVHNFGVRKASMRPMNLFDTKDCMMLFNPINTPLPYSNVEVDLALKVLREEFLCLVVTLVISKIPEDMDDSSTDSDYIKPSPVGVRECEEWIHKCCELGRSWGVDLDSLRINQVCEFYSSGFDFLGLESIGAVSSKDILGSKLLVIAGMRLNYCIQSHHGSTMEMVSSMSTNLSNWLNKLDYSKLRCLRFSQSSIAELARHVAGLIPESNYDHKLAEDLQVCASFLAT